MTDQEFVEYVVKAIVNNPNEVRTERSIDELGVLITLYINQADMAHVIGRRGQTARAIRTLLRTVGAKANSRVNLKIYEPEEIRMARMAEREARGESNHQADHGNRGMHNDRTAEQIHQDELADVDTSAVDDLKI